MARRLVKDREAERDVGRLRIVAAALTAIAAAWLLFLTSFAWWALVVAGVVAIAARFWIVSWSRIERTPAPDLVLSDTTLQLGERTVPWAEVERVELDQDRMVVRVVTKDGPIELEPPYGGLGLDALGRAVEDARLAKR